MNYPNPTPSGNSDFLARNNNLARTVAALFRRLDPVSRADAMQTVNQLHATLVAAGLSFSDLASAVEMLPWERMASSSAAMLRISMDNRHALTDWEQNFIASLDEWRGELRPKQLERLRSIAKRLYFTEWRE
jgi:hypothetical protein